MKAALYLGLILGLVPFQTTVLELARIGPVRPDLCLVAVVLVGVFAGELEGLLMGLALGFVQDLFSAGDAWLNLALKGAAGVVAGLTGRHVANATPLTILALMGGLSAASGLIVLSRGREALGLGALTVYGPGWLGQAACDALICTGLYWLIAGRVRLERASGKEWPVFWH